MQTASRVSTLHDHKRPSLLPTMGSVLSYIEYGLGRLFINQKGRDAKLFIKGPAFADFPEPTFEVDSLECGPSNSVMDIRYTQFKEDRFPGLKWSGPGGDVKEYLVVIEDPDAPLPTPPAHAIFYQLPPSKTEITHDDIQLIEPGSREKGLKGGFKVGKNLRGHVYGGPRPVLGHGPHRYYYEVIALKEPLDVKKMSPIATKAEILEDIVGKVAGWGVWIGTYENKWE